MQSYIKTVGVARLSKGLKRLSTAMILLDAESFVAVENFDVDEYERTSTDFHQSRFSKRGDDLLSHMVVQYHRRGRA